MKTKIIVPATSANLSCGFDSFGCSFSFFDEIELTEGDGERKIIDKNPDFCNDRNLAFKAFEKTLEITGKTASLEKLDTQNCPIPFSRGLGSSSALIVAGVMGALLLSKTELDKKTIVEIATEIEGHPDNVAPCVYGGFTVSAMTGKKIVTSKFDFHESLAFAVIIPPYKLSTSTARGVLPKTVPFADAVFNLSRTPILADGLTLGDAEKIRFAMDDRLHQPYRKKLIPEYDLIEKTCLDSGAISFCLSGAGPTMLSVFKEKAAFGKIKAALQKEFPDHKVMMLSPDNFGARVEQ